MISIWLILLILVLPPDQKKVSGDRPSGLMVELIRHPDKVRISDRNPEFSWIVPAKAGSQTAWQILMSSSRESLLRDDPDYWNSNRTPGSKSTEVEYSGRALSDNSDYFWKVRIWDTKGRISAWSDIQLFRTGILTDHGTTGDHFIRTYIRPEKIVKTGERHYFADFGKDAFGTLILDLNPLKKDTLLVHLGEKTEGTNRIDRNPGGSIRYHRIILPVTPEIKRYIVEIPPDVRNTGPSAIHLPDSIGVITPFRYCELEDCDFEINSENLQQAVIWSCFDDGTSSFECSDTVLNHIWKMCKYSIKATSFAGIYVDGDRERIPYEADAYINQLGHYYTDRGYPVARRTAEYFISHPTWPTEWILQTISLFYNDLMYTGNYELAAHHYDELKAKTLISHARPDGLISSGNVTDEIMSVLGFTNPKERIRDIVDWPPAQKDTDWKLAGTSGERDGYDMVEVNTVVNAFHYNSLIRMSEISGYLGKSADSLLWRSRAGKVKEAFNKVFLNEEKGIYTDGESSGHSSLHANMMALAFGLVPEKYKETVIGFIKSRGMACSVYGAQYLLEGLYREGEAEYAMSLMNATNDRSWWKMIRSGSTITMEAWDMKYKPNSDWNHAWGAAPTNIIPAYIWGIRPFSPGYAKAIIRPQLANLTYSKILVPTIRGEISAEFRKNGNSKEYLITIPGNMECEFMIPGSVKELTVKFNGKSMKSVVGSIRLKPGVNKIVVKPKNTLVTQLVPP